MMPPISAFSSVVNFFPELTRARIRVFFSAMFPAFSSAVSWSAGASWGGGGGADACVLCPLSSPTACPLPGSDEAGQSHQTRSATTTRAMITRRPFFFSLSIVKKRLANNRGALHYRKNYLRIQCAQKNAKGCFVARSMKNGGKRVDKVVTRQQG